MGLYLGPGEAEQMVQTIMDTIGYGSAVRAAVTGNLPMWLRGMLPGGNPPELVSALLDVRHLDGIEPLSDGTVALKVFLQSVLFLAGRNVAADRIRTKIADIEACASGAPPIPASPMTEVQEKFITRTAMVGWSFLNGALAAATSVALIAVTRCEGGEPTSGANGEPVVFLGTCWLIAPNLMITNHHVVNARRQGEEAADDADLRMQAAGCAVRFDYDGAGEAGVTLRGRELLAWNAELDYALFWIDPSSRLPLRIADQAILQVDPAEAPAVNLIQHPDGGPKQWGVRNNLVSSADVTDLRYFTDTQSGSSGSPVLTDAWEVVALHRGAKFVTGVRYQGRDVAYVNVGTQMRAILADLDSRSIEVPGLGGTTRAPR